MISFKGYSFFVVLFYIISLKYYLRSLNDPSPTDSFITNSNLWTIFQKGRMQMLLNKTGKQAVVTSHRR